jgi:hypothetical protein
MPVKTDYTDCPTCHVRVIWPVTKAGVKLPPANYGPDPAGRMAIQHTATGAWLARFLAIDEGPIFPEKRYSAHHCERTP